MRLRSLFITAPLLLAFFGSEAPLSYQASVGTVGSSGFYRIPLRPVHTEHLRNDMRGLRLYGEEKGETPFWIRTVEEKTRSKQFRELKPLKVEQKRGYTGIIFERPEDSTVRKLVLYLEEPSRSTRVRIEGSEDARGGWIQVQAEERVRSSIRDTASSEFWLGGFLGSGHRYYRIRIGAPAPPPPTLLTMGYREAPKGSDAFQELPTAKLEQKDLDEKSYMRISLDTLRRVDELELDIEGPRFFRRNATVALPEGTSDTLPVPYEPIGGAVLSDTVERIGSLEPSKSEELLLLIQNGDGLPLKIEGVRLFQKRRYLLAYLEKGDHYALRFDGKKEARPSYELHRIQERIPDDPPVLKAGPPRRIEAGSKPPGEWSSLWLWLSILFSVLVLGAFSYRSVKEGKD